jgi:hypothetical protein
MSLANDQRSRPQRYESDISMKNGSKKGEGGASPSQLIDARIEERGDWRGETLARVRMLIREADPQVVEEWKYEPRRQHQACHRCP